MNQFYEYTSYEYDLSVPALSEILKLIGLPTTKILEIQFPHVPHERRKDIGYLILDTLTQYIKNYEGALYDGIKDVIAKLCEDGYRLVIASNGRFTIYRCYFEYL